MPGAQLATKEKGIASLISHLAMSFTASPARFRAIGIARLGAIVKSMGFVAASPHDNILAIGFTDDDCDRSRVARTSAEAPSLIAEAFAAVTVPSFLSVRYSCTGVELEHRFQSWYFLNFETFIFFVHRNFDIALFAFDNDWHDFFVEMACIPGLRCTSVSDSLVQSAQETTTRSHKHPELLAKNHREKLCFQHTIPYECYRRHPLIHQAICYPSQSHSRIHVLEVDIMEFETY